MRDRNEDFIRLFAMNQRRIHGFVAAMIPRTADVDDVFQEVSMSLWRKFEDFEPGTDFAAWAIQSARFYVLKHYERQRQLGRIVFDDELVNPVPPTMNHVTNPVDWEGLQDSLQVAKQRDVVCVAVDTQVKDDQLVLCQVVSDNAEAGRLAARSLTKARESARIAILHIPSNKACIDRVAGFQQEIAGHANMQTIVIEDGKGTAEGARPAMQVLLKRYPDIDAVFAVNDPSALGAIEAIEAAGRLDEITVVSVDGSRDGIAAVEAGKLFSTAVQFPREIGRIAAQRAYDHQNGNPVDRTIKVPLELVIPRNVHAFQATD